MMTNEDKEEVQQMIDRAMTRHNIKSVLISAILGFSLLGFYAHGLLTIIGKI